MALALSEPKLIAEKLRTESGPVAREGQAVLLALEEILPDLRPDGLEEKAYVRGDGIIAQDRMARLRQVARAQGDKQQSEDERDREQAVPSLEHIGGDDRH